MSASDPQSEQSFEERLKKARAKIDDGEAVEQIAAPSPMGIAFKMGIELVVGAGVGALIGWSLDDLFDTAPLLLIVFLILGFAAGIRNVIRDAVRMQDDAHNTSGNENDE